MKSALGSKFAIFPSENFDVEIEFHQSVKSTLPLTYLLSEVFDPLAIVQS